jgi:hypothetical protein
VVFELAGSFFLEIKHGHCCNYRTENVERSFMKLLAVTSLVATLTLSEPVAMANDSQSPDKATQDSLPEPTTSQAVRHDLRTNAYRSGSGVAFSDTSDVAIETNGITTNLTLIFDATDSHVSDIGDASSLESYPKPIVVEAGTGTYPMNSSALTAGHFDPRNAPAAQVPLSFEATVNSNKSWITQETQKHFLIRVSNGASGPETLMNVSITGNTLIISWWPAGGRLQMTRNLTGAATSWKDVGNENPAAIGIGEGTSFYRVAQ